MEREIKDAKARMEKLLRFIWKEKSKMPKREWTNQLRL